MAATGASGGAAPVRLITLDPGHFHAALVQKFMYEGVDPVVHVYAPAGDDVEQHLETIERFNSRAENPTNWNERVYTGNDFFERMLAEKPGNVVVLAGKNARKAEYILKSVEAGLNVLADKPMAVVPSDLEHLRKAFEIAAANGLLLYDIMTERHEITTILQRELSRVSEVFGDLAKGGPDAPAITKESVHHFSKIVAGLPLKRPPWFFDVRQQGEGIVDVTTHLVDLVQWEAFPGEILRAEDATVLDAARWSTPIEPAGFKQLTGADDFPAFLAPDVKDGILHVFANGAFTYRLRDIHARISVVWNFEAPPGGGDTHHSVMRGTRADLVIRQGREQDFKPVLYVEPRHRGGVDSIAAAVTEAMNRMQRRHPGIASERRGDRVAITIPDRYDVGHEAHFSQVTTDFLGHLRAGRFPDWEVPNMMTKCATVMQAYEMSRRG